MKLKENENIFCLCDFQEIHIYKKYQVCLINNYQNIDELKKQFFDKMTIHLMTQYKRINIIMIFNIVFYIK